MASLLSLHGMMRVGSILSVFGLSWIESLFFLSVVDCSSVGSFLFARSPTRLDSVMSFFDMAALGSSPLPHRPAHIGLLLPLLSACWLGFTVSVFDSELSDFLCFCNLPATQTQRSQPLTLEISSHPRPHAVLLAPNLEFLR